MAPLLIAEVPGWLVGMGVVGGFVTAIAGAFAAVRKLGPDTRLTDKQVDEIEDRLRRDLLKDIEELRKSNAAIAADLAKAHSELATAQVEANKLQIHYQGQIDARDRRIGELESKVKALEGEVHTLKIKLGHAEGRRSDDPHA